MVGLTIEKRQASRNSMMQLPLLPCVCEPEAPQHPHIFHRQMFGEKNESPQSVRRLFKSSGLDSAGNAVWQGKELPEQIKSTQNLKTRGL